MTDRMKNGLLVLSLMLSAGLGAAALAGAASNGNSGSPNAQAAAPIAQNGPRGGGMPHQRSDETLLTGDTASKVRAAALKAVSGGTIERVETDADGNAKYEAHMTRADGSRVTVYVNDQFEVVDTQVGPYRSTSAAVREPGGRPGSRGSQPFQCRADVPGVCAGSHSSGSVFSPWRRTSKWRWTPSQAPVQPTAPSTVADVTAWCSPTAMLSRWAYTVSSPRPWSTMTRFP